MSDFFEKKGITDEARISIILNTFMYIDKCPESMNTQTLGSIIQQMSYDGLEDTQKAALWIMKDTLTRNKDAAELELITFSENMPSLFKGAYAAAFKKSDGSEVYVVYRGTGSGRWYDNGDGLANVSSEYQRRAVWYFNDVVKLIGEKAPQKLVVTGHSKGGNLSQYVTFKSKYKSMVTRCISFDGQGFSPEFLKELNCPDDEFKAICGKMYSICGDNDYVNVLGKKIIPFENTIYIKTHTEWKDLFGAHSIVPASFADVKEHYCDFLYDFSKNCFNEQTIEQREIARCSKELSAHVMELGHDKREDICRTLMTVAEKFLGGTGSPEGVQGEMATLDENVGFLTNLFEVIGPVTSYAGKKAAEDTIFKYLILSRDKNADPSLAYASNARKISYIMSDPDITKMYYLGASLAIESCADMLGTAFTGLGRLIAPGSGRDLSWIANMQLKASARVAGAISSAKGKVSEALEKWLPHEEVQSTQCMASQDSWDNFSGVQQADGRNVINGTDKEDYIIGESGDDVIFGFAKNDSIHGGEGNDEICGGEGNDTLYGDSGNDKLSGEGGDDTIIGGNGNDFLHGGLGNDDLRGGRGNDILNGSIGDDILNGGEGDDTLSGGAGNDTYVFEKGFGRDTINDREGDNVLEFRNITPDELQAAMENDTDLLIKISGTSDQLTIRNYDLCKNNFTFIISGMRYRLNEQHGSYTFVRI